MTEKSPVMSGQPRFICIWEASHLLDEQELSISRGKDDQINEMSGFPEQALRGQGKVVSLCIFWAAIAWLT